jgi:hypothetical protein
VIAGVLGTGKCPVHDRWWLTTTGEGLRFGTSASGLGNRWSEISEMQPEAVVEKLAEMQPFFLQGVRQFKGEPLKYSTISL